MSGVDLSADNRGRRGPAVLPLNELAPSRLATVRVVLTDIDDTLTRDGRLPASAYQAMEALEQAGVKVVPVTGRPAGWCDMIARFWPVSGVVGENGAFYFCFKRDERRVERFYAVEETLRVEQVRRLEELARQILAQVPGTALASDQFCRLVDVAIDYCEDVPALGEAEVRRIVAMFEEAGATAKVSSIHVNAWFGDHNKRSTSEIMLRREFGLDLGASDDEVVYIGDSPNDEPMFEAVDLSVAVSSIRPFLAGLSHPPRYICDEAGGEGFVVLAEALLSAREIP